MKKTIIIICIFTLISCQSTSSTNHSLEQLEMYSMDQVVSDQYEVFNIGDEVFHDELLVGMANDDTYLYFTDQSGQAIIKYDPNTQDVQKYTLPQLVKATILTYANQKLYVVDEAFNMIYVYQILEDDFILEQEYAITLRQPQTFYADIAVDQQFIYLTYFDADKETAKIEVIDQETSNEHLIGDGFVGYVYMDEHRPYAIQLLEYYQENQEEGFRMGNNPLFQIDNEQLVQKANLIQGSAPADFLIKDQQLYVYSAGWSSIDVYQMDGTYQQSLAKFNESDMKVSLVMLHDEFYVLFRELHILYLVKKK